MAERETRTETLRAGAPLTVGAVSMVPIERVVLHAQAGGSGIWCSVAKEPYALIVRERGDTRAVGIDGAEVSLEELREQVPGLDALLASWRKRQE